MITLDEILYLLLAIQSIALIVSGYFIYIFKKNVEVLEANIADKELSLDHTKSQNKILNHEIDKTKQISKAFYPKREHIISSKFDICGINVPSHKVSGDYYDIFTSFNNIYFGIGDVTGHGLTSSILSLIISRKIRTLIDLGMTNIPSILESCNNEIVTEGTKYMSLLIGRITYGDKVETYGKQESILVCKPSGIDVLNNKSGFILGNNSFNKENIPKNIIEIESNEFIIFYTDGVSELENSNKEDLGIEGIKKFIMDNMSTLRYIPAAGICQEIVDFLAMWGADYVEDDITLLVIKKK